jgi:predicted nucleotidyltransferase
MQPDQDQLRELVRQIVDTVHPLRVILFGSAARGAMGPHSDVDLLVVMPEGTHRLNTMGLIYRSIRKTLLPFDVIVATPGDLAKYGDTPGLIYREIIREGRELYAA